jgi:hypothetical protein
MCSVSAKILYLTLYLLFVQSRQVIDNEVLTGIMDISYDITKVIDKVALNSPILSSHFNTRDPQLLLVARTCLSIDSICSWRWNARSLLAFSESILEAE